MSANPLPTFEPFGRLPTEIRSIIFAYMIQDTIESHMKLSEYSNCVFRHQYQIQGLHASAATAHLTSSPWVTLNKQYCVEYLQVFVRNVELRERFTSPYRRWRASTSSYSDDVTEPKRLTALEKVLKLITQRFDIAGPYAGIETSSRMLVSRIRGVCLSYTYWRSYFERGFGKTERREFPCEGFLKGPLKCLRRLHEHYNIPSNKLSIKINYGDPSWTVLACLGLPNSSDAPKYVVSLRPVRAHIQVDDYNSSVVAIDKELEVLKKTLGEVIRDIRIAFPEPERLMDFLMLERMTNRDMELLRRDHLRAIDQITTFWEASGGGAEADVTTKNTKR